MVGTCWPDVKRFCCDLLSAFLHEPNNPCRLWYMTRGYIKKQQRSSVSHCLGLRHKLLLGPQMYTRVGDNKNTIFALFEIFLRESLPLSETQASTRLVCLQMYTCIIHTKIMVKKNYEDDRIFFEAPKSQNDLFSVDYFEVVLVMGCRWQHFKRMVQINR